MADNANNSPGHRTIADLEQELVNKSAEQHTALHQARKWFEERVAEDIAWWYARAQNIAEKGTTRTDQVRYQMVKAILDKILPDKKEITRGAATTGAALVQINLDQPGAAPRQVNDDGQTVDAERLQ